MDMGFERERMLLKVHAYNRGKEGGTRECIHDSVVAAHSWCVVTMERLVV